VCRSNCYIEGIHSIRPPSREGDILDSRAYIRSKGPIKKHYAQAYKLKSPLSISGKERIGNIRATIILSATLVEHYNNNNNRG